MMEEVTHQFFLKDAEGEGVRCMMSEYHDFANFISQYYDKCILYLEIDYMDESTFMGENGNDLRTAWK